MPDRLEDYPSLERQLLQEFSDLRVFWDKTQLKRFIGILFSRMRKMAGMSQRDVAGIAGWDKAFISRLEGVEGGVPDLQTISKYADACNMDVGIVVTTRLGSIGYVRIIDAISLNSSTSDGTEKATSIFDTLRDREIEVNNP